MRGKSVMLLAGLASLAQANELNLYSVNTGSYVYHLTNNHGQYTEISKIIFSQWSGNSLQTPNTAFCLAL